MSSPFQTPRGRHADNNARAGLLAEFHRLTELNARMRQNLQAIGERAQWLPDDGDKKRILDLVAEALK